VVVAVAEVATADTVDRATELHRHGHFR
jgi:hypothetical protein